MRTADDYDVVIVGGGQAGLALGRELTLRNLSLLILDAGDGPGASWQARWDSLRLFTPAGLSALPGLPFPGAPERLPTKDEVAGYLAAYHARFDLPVRWRTRVCRLTGADARYALETADGVVNADQVVLAPGSFQRPWLPPAARTLGDAIYQVHSTGYRCPDRLPDGPTLVVGAGNSGLQIADEIARTRQVTLAVGALHPYLPERVAGRSVFWWLDRLGFMRIGSGSRLGRSLRRRKEVVVGNTPRRLHRRRGVRLVPRVVASRHGSIVTADGSVHHPQSVVWATGYIPDLSWVDLPVVAPDGWVRQEAGRTELPGLYTIGLPWQRTNGSALLGWVGRDARSLADVIAVDATTHRPHARVRR